MQQAISLQEKIKQVIGLMKDELRGGGGEIMIEFVALRPKTYSYLMVDSNSGTHVNKKAKGTK